jgi:hypothetical protein
MTHDELLAEINLASRGEYASLAVALIAVVKLITKENTIPLDDYHFGYMAACKAVYEAIEKELK